MNLINTLISEGWHEAPPGNNEKPAIRSAYSPHTGLPDCESNVKSPNIWIKEYWFSLDHQHHSFSIELRGELNGVWHDLMVYGIKNEEQMRKGIEHVRVAWTAIADAVKVVK